MGHAGAIDQRDPFEWIVARLSLTIRANLNQHSALENAEFSALPDIGHRQPIGSNYSVWSLLNRCADAILLGVSSHGP
jgi:hypothetical protein